MDHRDAIERYYRAFRERDRETLRELLTPDFHHVSAFAEWRDRDAMLEAIWPEVGRAWAVNLEIFGAPPRFMVRYDYEWEAGASHRPARMAELVRFEGERIAEIEVYVGRDMRGASAEGPSAS